MELELIRTYFPYGTNGEILYNNERLCSSIELPWLGNQHKISCIPEGRYELRKRYSLHFGWHLQVMNVRNRDLILMHPANDALKELQGCIAPVSFLTAEGKGYDSKKALKKLKALAYAALDKQEQVFITIKSKSGETNFQTC